MGESISSTLANSFPLRQGRFQRRDASWTWSRIGSRPIKECLRRATIFLLAGRIPRFAILVLSNGLAKKCSYPGLNVPLWDEQHCRLIASPFFEPGRFDSFKELPATIINRVLVRVNQDHEESFG